MKVLQSTEAKAHFSSLLRDVESGNEVAIVYGKKKQTIAVIVPYEQWKKSKKRQLGTLKAKAKVHFSADFSISDEELVDELEKNEIFDNLDSKDDEDISIESVFGLWKDYDIDKAKLREKAWRK